MSFGYLEIRNPIVFQYATRDSNARPLAPEAAPESESSEETANLESAGSLNLPPFLPTSENLLRLPSTLASKAADVAVGAYLRELATGYALALSERAKS